MLVLFSLLIVLPFTVDAATAVKWIAGGSGLACDEICPMIGAQCSRQGRAWSFSQAMPSSIQSALGYECTSMKLATDLHVPSANDGACSWRDVAPASMDELCVAKPPSGIVRFCACELLVDEPQTMTVRAKRGGFSAAVGGTVGAEPSQNLSAPLYQVPFLMSHDSATGFIGEGDIRHRIYQTQTLNFVEQLSCGVRAFDVRVAYYPKSGTMHFHHSPGPGTFNKLISWISDQTVDGEIPKVVEWSNAHPNELVLLVVSHCYRSGGWFGETWETMDCKDPAIIGGFTKHGIHAETDCPKVNSMTLAEAQQVKTANGKGNLMLIPGQNYCVQSNFDKYVTKFDEVDPYIVRTMKDMSDKKSLFQVQSFLQQTDQIVVPLATVAKLNLQVYQWLTQGTLLDGVNLLEINMACASGPSISRELGATVTSSEQDQCVKSCVLACERFGACHQSAAHGRSLSASSVGVSRDTAPVIYT